SLSYHASSGGSDDLAWEAVLNEFRQYRGRRQAIFGSRNTIPPLPEGDKMACHIQGTAEVEKLAGNLHITALGHGYRSPTHAPHESINFTHRFVDISFGRQHPGLALANPLAGIVEVTKDALTMYQYFVSVVPTMYSNEAGTTGTTSFLTNQYAVTENMRVLDQGHKAGTPGIFIRFDLEPVSLYITDKRSATFQHFLVRLCGILGGVFVTVGMAYRVVNRFGSVLAGENAALATAASPILAPAAFSPPNMGPMNSAYDGTAYIHQNGDHMAHRGR
ncbi:hypothetical protein HDU93_004037, partial [Gonapodya sp. JEL0774]